MVTTQNGEVEAAPDLGHPGKTSNGSSSLTSNSTGCMYDTGLADAVDQRMRTTPQVHGSSSGSFSITPEALGAFANDRTRLALAKVIENGLGKQAIPSDPEAPSESKAAIDDMVRLAQRMKELESDGPPPEHTPEEVEANRSAEVATNVLVSVLLKSNPERGISSNELELRRDWFGTNAIADKSIASFLRLCWEAVQDFVLIMLIVLGAITIAVEVSVTLDKGDRCTTCWIEGTAILCSVCIVVLVTAGIDYGKQFAFIRLTESLNETNTKSVIRDGRLISVTDDDIVVGDILSVNSHNLASIPADCVLLGPRTELKMDESTLTGESKHVNKLPGDVVLSGTTAKQGSGKMIVIAVGINSVAGKIKARVYESEDHEDELDGEDESSPLTVKLDLIAKQIGIVGTTAAIFAFAISCILGLAAEGDPPEDILEYLVVAITVLAVAVPEGLPLAVTLALAFSSNKMTKEQNLVKHLDACETMGCATTICTDKTGTLTANKMTARALYMSFVDYLVQDPSVKLADYVRTLEGGAGDILIDLLCRLISVDTMDETVLYVDKQGSLEGSSGNPTEVALLTLVHELGQDYEAIRSSTRGRAHQGALAEYLTEGKQFGFSSSRKMMSWAVPRDEGGYRIYCKGAQEVVTGRCVEVIEKDGNTVPLSDNLKEEILEKGLSYTRRGMRCLGVAYRDLPNGFDLEEMSSIVKNSDGSDAFEVETNMVFVGILGIEDPLRPEVPGAIRKCYTAGIDVRMVTGDNPETAVSIAYQAGIVRDEHFFDPTEHVASNLKENVMLEGKEFRAKVYRQNEEGEDEFDQEAFDEIWPHLRVLARSSPDDKLTLAHGLNQSNLYTYTSTCQRLKEFDNIKIFPDRQVIAMTGDGTNDAPALKRADIGFAMGIAGTQIAKDAADIILLDDNFASIVTAAKWGRNIYASIQKFLQFQLTVNISALVTTVVGAAAYQESPLAAIQLLWVNLLMDSLASLALASEPPVDSLLEKPPVNRTEHMITRRMWANMLGQATYQIIVIMILLFQGPEWLDVEAGHIVEDRNENSVHYTIIFNAFVWMQLFNEINSRMLKGECNVFAGILRNPLFCGILLGTMGVQAVIVQYGFLAFRVSEGGLEGRFWILSLVLGLGSLPVQQVINVLYRLVFTIWLGYED